MIEINMLFLAYETGTEIFFLTSEAHRNFKAIAPLMRGKLGYGYVHQLREPLTDEWRLNSVYIASYKLHPVDLHVILGNALDYMDSVGMIKMDECNDRVTFSVLDYEKIKSLEISFLHQMPTGFRQAPRFRSLN